MRLLGISFLVLLMTRSAQPCDHVIFRLEWTGGAVDTSAMLEDVFAARGESWVELTVLERPSCATPDTVFWVLCGTFPYNHSLGWNESLVLLTHASSGGALYFEGGETWTFDAQTRLAWFDGHSGHSSRGPSPASVSGLDSGLALDLSSLTSLPIDWDVDPIYPSRLIPGRNDTFGALVSPLWTIAGSDVAIGLAYAGDNGARIICQSWELGGISSAQSDIVGAMIDFFNGATPPCYFVTDLTVAGDCSTGQMFIEWSAPPDGTEALLGFQVFRDGAVIANLPPTQSSYNDTGAPDGLVTYGVRAVCTSSTTSAIREVTTTVVSSGPPANIVLRLDKGTGLVDSATAIEESLVRLGDTYAEYRSVDDIDCLSNSTRIWVVTGTFPDNYPIDDELGALLAHHVLTGGSVYVERTAGGPTSSTVFDQFDGASPSGFSGVEVSELTGFSGALDTSAYQAVPYLGDQPGSDENEHYQIFETTLGSDVTPLWVIPAATPVVLGVAYRTDPPYGNIITQSWELGGFTGDLDQLVQLYSGFLSPGAGTAPTAGYLRGDINGNGAIDVSDLIRLMQYYYSGAPVPCLDAADLNLDQVIDLGDLQSLQLLLFFPGSDRAPLPYPDCGPGPVLLGCATPTCP